MAISVIIPIAEGDEAWKALIQDLRVLSVRDEVLFVATEPSLQCVRAAPFDSLSCPVNFVPSAVGRAKQLNCGAEAAKNDFLWFLHCDSRFSAKTFQALTDAISRAPDAIYFFDLKFLGDGPMLMRLNELGAWIRSRVLRLPFGDQGFAMSRAVFQRLGGFCLTAPYGEDHLLVWSAHRKRVTLRSVGAPLLTSARKYKDRGWRRTTTSHLWLTARQALPEFFQLLRQRVLR